jgi:type II secretory pathway pseudopilin PulG
VQDGAINLVRKELLGFSLAELLMVLLILGELAAFSIPKVLNSQNQARKNAVFKENIAAIQQVVHLLVLKGDIATRSHTCGTNSPANIQLIVNQLNYVKKVNCGATCERLYFANGSRMSIGRGHVLDFQVDWDDTNGLGAWGDDMLYFHYNDCDGIYQGLDAGRFGPINSVPATAAERTANFALWYDIFD